MQCPNCHLDLKPVAAILEIKAITHEQYPWVINADVALVGCTLSFLASKDNNLLGPVIAHDVADWVLDLFFEFIVQAGFYFLA